MKHSDSEAGLFSRLAKLFTHNLGLKILALVLAILLYETIRQSSLNESPAIPAPHAPAPPQTQQGN
ncbi:MAG: hypothetical protein K6F50_05875 [Kiritimatiellae bacterium]|nr:hypothetical protein [Kiritimatiellia bacterium]